MTLPQEPEPQQPPDPRCPAETAWGGEPPDPVVRCELFVGHPGEHLVLSGSRGLSWGDR